MSSCGKIFMTPFNVAIKYSTVGVGRLIDAYADMESRKDRLCTCGGEVSLEQCQEASTGIVHDRVVRGSPSTHHNNTPTRTHTHRGLHFAHVHLSS